MKWWKSPFCYQTSRKQNVSFFHSLLIQQRLFQQRTRLGLVPLGWPALTSAFTSPRTRTGYGMFTGLALFDFLASVSCSVGGNKALVRQWALWHVLKCLSELRPTAEHFVGVLQHSVKLFLLWTVERAEEEKPRKQKLRSLKVGLGSHCLLQLFPMEEKQLGKWTEDTKCYRNQDGMGEHFKAAGKLRPSLPIYTARFTTSVSAKWYLVFRVLWNTKLGSGQERTFKYKSTLVPEAEK